MIALCIAVVILVLLLILPVGVDFYWLSRPLTTRLQLKIGPLLLKPGKGKKAKRPPKAAHKGGKEKTAGKKPSIGKGNIPGLIRLMLGLLSRFRRHLSVDLLRIQYCAGGKDPFAAAMNYGRANALLCSLLPLARSALKIRSEEIATSLDFNSDKSILEAHVVATLQIWEILWLGFHMLLALRRQKREMKKTGAKSD
ncbi:MAG: hypothetical protein IJ617_06445 [Oscillospiraceae bacterium]|nr:hypothetical protein [Oscillospiraceae bacterium]